MGAGWWLVFTDRPQVSGATEWPAAATIRTIERNIWRSSARWNSIWRPGDLGRVPLQGDSRLVINQMTCAWGSATRRSCS
jgi:hypothetical protein